MREWFRDVLGISFGMAIFYLAMICVLIVGGLLVNQIFFEPQRQQAYQFEVSSKLNDWCGAKVDDPFNMQTLASLKTNVNGEPKRFDKLSPELKQQIEAAIRSDRIGACGVDVK